VCYTNVVVRVLLISANREQLPSPVVPLGVLSVAAAVADVHEVLTLDLCFEPDPLQSIASKVASFRPDVVGLGLRNLHGNAYADPRPILAQYEAMARTLRETTGAPLVLGGAGFSLQPAHLLERLGADHGVVGEGERAFRTVVDTLEKGEKPARLVYGSAGDLDRLAPPLRSQIDPRYYAFDGTDNVQTKRGCAFGCTYCDYPDLEGRRVRVRSPASVADELLARSRVPGVTHAFLVDSVFNVPKGHALSVCNELIARGSPLPWVCYGSPVAFDDRLVSAMVRAGCQGVEIGADAGSAAMLRKLQKPFGLAEILETRRLFLKHGLLDCYTFVLGAEGETPEQVRETLSFVDALEPDVAAFLVFTEDRETMSLGGARHRDAILELLAREAPRRPGWVVPELGIRFGRKLTRVLEHRRVRGPAWLWLARQRRSRLSSLVA
jgi:hypothetical protein